MKIKKTKLNLSIDIIMFLVMMAVAGIGFLIKYVLISGHSRKEVYGRDVELYYLGLDRHEWGSIHLILSFLLLFFLLLHIVFHWKQITAFFKSMISAKKWRVVLSVILVSSSLILAVMPLFVKPEVQEGSSHHSHQQELWRTLLNEEHAGKSKHTANNKSSTELTTTEDAHEHSHNSDIEIYGYMSLNEVSEKYSIPATELAECIKVPAGHTNEKLGRLKKEYDFNLDDLRTFIEKAEK